MSFIERFHCITVAAYTVRRTQCHVVLSEMTVTAWLLIVATRCGVFMFAYMCAQYMT